MATNREPGQTQDQVSTRPPSRPPRPALQIFAGVNLPGVASVSEDVSIIVGVLAIALLGAVLASVAGLQGTRPR